MALLSFVVPCYRSALTITPVVDDIIATVALHPGYDYEIVLVNDGSPDDTESVIMALAAGNPRVKAVSLARNFGEHGALMAGFGYVSGEIVIVLDDDGQNPPSEAFKFVAAIEQGADAVFARYREKKHTLLQNLGSAFNSKMAEFIMDKPKDLQIMSYLACRRFVIEEVKRYRNPYPYVTGLILQTTNRLVNVDVMHKERAGGHSNYTLKKLVSLWLNGFTTFSVKPLRLATFSGIICAVLGFIYGIYVVAEKLIVPRTPIGYSSIMAAILFIGGVIMLMLGMIGEYIGRTYISINSRPQYVIRKTSIRTEDPPEPAGP